MEEDLKKKEDNIKHKKYVLAILLEYIYTFELLNEDILIYFT